VYQDIKKEEKREQLAEKKERVNADNNEDIIINNKIKVLPGQVWRLGKHTLICGNFYEAKDVKADAIITDPPYGINYNPDWKKWDNTKSDFNKIKGDDNEFNPIAFLKYNTVLLFGANYFTKHLPIGSWLCWDKRTKEELDDMLGSPFELAWFKSINTKKTAIMVRILHGGVINADSKIGNNEKRYHPTQKPIVLFEEILQKLTKPNDVILDPFIGSGTTLLAAERTNRICIGYEIDPTYCEIIINRFKNLTNQEAWQELKG
jgi:DNA modification methylase